MAIVLPPMGTQTRIPLMEILQLVSGIIQKKQMQDYLMGIGGTLAGRRPAGDIGPTPPGELLQEVLKAPSPGAMGMGLKLMEAMAPQYRAVGAGGLAEIRRGREPRIFGAPEETEMKVTLYDETGRKRRSKVPMSKAREILAKNPGWVIAEEAPPKKPEKWTTKKAGPKDPVYRPGTVYREEKRSGKQEIIQRSSPLVKIGKRGLYDPNTRKFFLNPETPEARELTTKQILDNHRYWTDMYLRAVKVTEVATLAGMAGFDLSVLKGLSPGEQRTKILDYIRTERDFWENVRNVVWKKAAPGLPQPTEILTYDPTKPAGGRLSPTR